MAHTREYERRSTQHASNECAAWRARVRRSTARLWRREHRVEWVEQAVGRELDSVTAQAHHVRRDANWLGGERTRWGHAVNTRGRARRKQAAARAEQQHMQTGRHCDVEGNQMLQQTNAANERATRHGVGACERWDGMLVCFDHRVRRSCCIDRQASKL